MNIGIIYKVKVEGAKKYFIKLERNVKIEDKEYNIFIKIENKKPKAQLLSVNTEFSSAIDLADFLGKKLNFEINLNSYEITSIEYPVDEK